MCPSFVSINKYMINDATAQLNTRILYIVRYVRLFIIRSSFPFFNWRYLRSSILNLVESSAYATARFRGIDKTALS